MSSFVKTKYVQCSKCKGRVGPIDQPGFYYTPLHTVVECICHKEWVRKNRLMLRAQKATISESFFDFDLQTDYQGQMSRPQIDNLILFIKRFGEVEEFRSQCLYIAGKEGTQKTFIAKWIGAEFLRQGYSVRYLKMKKLVSIVTPDFKGDKEKKNQEIRELLSVDILILDEAFQYKIHDYEMIHIENFLRERVEDQERSIYFVSRVFPSEIKSIGYSESIQQFIMRLTEKRKALFTMLDIYESNFDLNAAIRGTNGS